MKVITRTSFLYILNIISIITFNTTSHAAIANMPPPGISGGKTLSPKTQEMDPNNIPILPLLTSSPPTTIPTFFSWNMQEYPNPMTHPKICNRSSASLLCDVDHILTKEQASKLEHLMVQTTNVSHCYCKECPNDKQKGIQVAIALVRHIFRPYNSPHSNSQEFANHLRAEWKFGTCDNTVLILLVAAADEISLSVGAIAETVFDESFFGSLIAAHRNEFENGRFYEGLVSIIGGMRHHMISSKAPTNLDHDAMLMGGSATRAGGGGTSAQPTAGSTTKTAVAVVGIIVGFLLVIFILTGTILMAKKRFETIEGTIICDDKDTRPKPEGYWSGARSKEFRDQDDSDDGDNSIHRGTDEVDGSSTLPAPPLPTTPPPSTPSPSLANRKLSTPSGVVEYEPLSIEDDHDRRRPTSATNNSAPNLNNFQSEAADDEVGQEELLEASSRISTPETERHSRL